jgi:hypothetical protein
LAKIRNKQAEAKMCQVQFELGQGNFRSSSIFQNCQMFWPLLNVRKQVAAFPAISLLVWGASAADLGGATSYLLSNEYNA